MTAKECVIRKVEECEAGESTNHQLISDLRQLRVADLVLNYVCRDHLEGIRTYTVLRSLIPFTAADIEDAGYRRFNSIL